MEEELRGDVVRALGPVSYEIEPLLFGEARIIVTDGANVFRQWWYRSVREALEALVAWTGRDLLIGEPEGWYRRIVDERKIEEPFIKCPRCDAVSHNPNDIRQKYCGRCHKFHKEF